MAVEQPRGQARRAELITGVFTQEQDDAIRSAGGVQGVRLGRGTGLIHLARGETNLTQRVPALHEKALAHRRQQRLNVVLWDTCLLGDARRAHGGAANERTDDERRFIAAPTDRPWREVLALAQDAGRV